MPPGPAFSQGVPPRCFPSRTARTDKAVRRSCAYKDWGGSTQRNASLEGDRSSEHANMIQRFTHWRDPPAKWLCARTEQLSKGLRVDALDSSRQSTGLIGCADCTQRSRKGARLKCEVTRRTYLAASGESSQSAFANKRVKREPSQALRTSLMRTEGGHSRMMARLRSVARCCAHYCRSAPQQEH
jgi:hypothetical protein